MADLIKTAVKGIASGVGLVSDGIHHHKERKPARAHSAESAQSAQSQPGDTPTDGSHGEGESHPALEEGDGEHWELDDAQDELMSVKSNSSSTSHSEHPKAKREIDPTKITDAFMERHPISGEIGPNGDDTGGHPHPKFPLPVILPQRRPQARARGFIRAYAPDLAIKDVNQETFLDFIENFNAASLASQWVNCPVLQELYRQNQSALRQRQFPACFLCCYLLVVLGLVLTYVQLDAINLAGFATIALPPGIS